MKIAIINPETKHKLTEKLFNTLEEAKNFQKERIKQYKKLLKKNKDYDFPRLTYWINASLQTVEGLYFGDWDICYLNQSLQHTPISQSKVIKEIDNQTVRIAVDKRINKVK